MSGKILQYVSLGFEIGTSVESIITLVESKQQLTGSQVQAAVAPAILGIESTFSQIVPDAVVLDICDAAAAAINKFGAK
jgi:hypothetical protein